MKKLSIFACILALFACTKEVKKTQVTITTQTSKPTYNLEVSTTDEELKKGLMFRESLEKDSGMLFVFDPVRPVAMWMKNTKISLDILFINPKGEIVCIKENATPMDESFIVCDKEISSAIEINAGEVAKQGIKIGNTVKY